MAFGLLPFLPKPSSDTAHVQAQAAAIEKVLKSPNPPGCGGKGAAWCAQRRVLIALGWIDPKLYGEKDIRAHSLPAIRRLQMALGVPPDGNWGPQTNGALLRVLEQALGRAVVGRATKKPPAAVAPQGPPPEAAVETVETPAPLLAKVPWIWVAGVTAVAVVGGFLAWRRGKKSGLSGCSCGMGAHDPEGEGEGDEEGLPPEALEEIAAVRQIPTFRPHKVKA